MRNAVAALAAAVAWATALPALADTITYTNARFGTSVSFPAGIFRQQMEPPDNSDGATFVAPDGGSIAVYGMNNAAGQSPAELADSIADPGERGDFEATYKRAGKDWVVVSGTEDGDIFYHRFEYGANDVLLAVLIKYPKTRKAEYDPLVGAIAGSLEGP